MNCLTAYAIGLIVSAVATVSVNAEDESERKAKSVELADVVGHLDLAIPQSPAFTILGVTPETVVKSDDLRTVAAGLLHGVDPNGNLQSGIAIDVRPYLALVGNESTLGEYQEHPSVRIASSAQLSFATASGQSDSDRADRQALGLTVKLWREHDPALGTSSLHFAPIIVPNHPPRAVAEDGLVHGTIGQCYGDHLLAASAAPEEFPGDDAATPPEEAIAANARKAIKGCLEPFKKQHWNAGSLELAVAGYRSEVEGLEENGFGAWIGYSRSLGPRGQVIVRSSYADNRLVPSKDTVGVFNVVDETDAGARIRFGSSRGTLMVEGLWTRAKSDTVEDKYYRASIGAEFMVLADIWIQLAVGKAYSTDLFDDDPVYSGQLRFGFSRESLIAGE